jgi:hypothetical protein
MNDNRKLRSLRDILFFHYELGNRRRKWDDLGGLGNDYRGVGMVACGAADAAWLVSFKR